MSAKQPPRGFARRVGRGLVWPFARLLDPRFQGLAKQADLHHADLVRRHDLTLTSVQGGTEEITEKVRAAFQSEGEQIRHEIRHEMTSLARASLASTQEANELIGRGVGDLLAEATSAALELEELTAATRDLGELTQTIRDVQMLATPEAAVGTDVAELRAGTAELLNYASSHRGFAAQRGIWFNPPISLRYEAGDVQASNTNERIVELPYLYRALSRAEPGAAVLDVGAAESIVSFSLASLGYFVTALDLNPYPLSHPRLRAVEADILEWSAEKPFDVVLCLSTLEHIGLGVYGEDPDKLDASADERALERMRGMTKPGGILVLTVPFGPASADESQRSYEQPEVERLLDGWSIEDFTVVSQDDDLTWSPDGDDDSDPARRAVALVTAVRPPD